MAVAKALSHAVRSMEGSAVTDAAAYQLAADAVLALHVAVVLFVVGGLAAVGAGNLAGWGWVNGIAFRALHLLAIGVVALQAWLGRLCPLTVLESWLREQAGQAPYAASFVQHWLQRLIYFDAPLWVFALAYTVFGLLVLAAWWRWPPRRATRSARTALPAGCAPLPRTHPPMAARSRSRPGRATLTSGNKEMP